MCEVLDCFSIINNQQFRRQMWLVSFNGHFWREEVSRTAVLPKTRWHCIFKNNTVFCESFSIHHKKILLRSANLCKILHYLIPILRIKKMLVFYKKNVLFIFVYANNSNCHEISGRNCILWKIVSTYGLLLITQTKSEKAVPNTF